MFVMKKYTELANKALGKVFGNSSYWVVAQSVRRFSATLSEDKSLRKKTERGVRSLSNIDRLLGKG